jgi:hypothetical protein
MQRMHNRKRAKLCGWRPWRFRNVDFRYPVRDGREELQAGSQRGATLPDLPDTALEQLMPFRRCEPMLQPSNDNTSIVNLHNARSVQKVWLSKIRRRIATGDDQLIQILLHGSYESKVPLSLIEGLLGPTLVPCEKTQLFGIAEAKRGLTGRAIEASYHLKPGAFPGDWTPAPGAFES